MNQKTINKALLHKRTKNFFFYFIIVLLCCVTLTVQAETLQSAVLLQINETIGPAVEDYVAAGLATAAAQNAAVVILQIDTPGGLDKSMREIIKSILASPVPVVSYVAPSGARAASAGTFILYASQIAAMAPGTNLGAATPVQLLENNLPSKTNTTFAASNQSSMDLKMRNDAVAYIKSLAELRHRNSQWAELAVTSAASLPATEALKLNVIDLIANNIPELLNAINGRTVSVRGQDFVLHTQNLPVETLNPNWRSKFLGVITDPTIAYILLLIGIYGLLIEFAHPGFVLPGVTGVIALILALFAFHMLPISYAGLSLMLLGLIFLIAEAFMPSFGVLGLGGIIAFVVGSVFLMNTEVKAYRINWSVIITMTILNAIFFLGIIATVIRARQRKIVSGREALIGMEGEALEDLQHEGLVLVNGERWQAISEMPIKQHHSIHVVAIKGLKLQVEAIHKKRSSL